MELLLFVSSHCPVCPRAEKIVKKVVRDYSNENLDFKKVRIRTSEGKQLSIELNIRATPTIVFRNNEGSETKRIVGVPDESQLKKEIDKGLGLKKGFLQKIFGK